MDLLFKTLKVSALLLFIFVLVVLCAPTIQGPFVVIHFATTLKAWLLIQLLFLGFVFAAHLLLGPVFVPLGERPHRITNFACFTPAIEPLRC